MDMTNVSDAKAPEAPRQKRSMMNFIGYTPPKLRLYAVKRIRDGELLTNERLVVLYFGSKRRAKAARNQVAKLTGDKHGVILGPDHKRATKWEVNNG